MTITAEDVSDALAHARAAVAHAQETRDRQRRRRRPDRMQDLLEAMGDIRNAQDRLRRYIMAATYRAVPREPELRGLSDQLQRERRKLWKMMQRTTSIGGLEGGWS